MAKYCSRCATAVDEEHRFCANCGQALAMTTSEPPVGSSMSAINPSLVKSSTFGLSAPPMPTDVESGSEVPPKWRRVRPWWLIGVLTLSTFSLYVFYWLYTTWRELKTERSDPQMYPFWHVLAMFVPIYNLFRFHAHIRTIRELAQSHRVPTSLSPGWCLVVWMIVGAIGMTSFRLSLRGIETPVWLDYGTTVALAAILAWAQSTLNTTWHAAPRGVAPTRVHPGEWVTIVIGGLVNLLVLVGTAVE